MTQERSASIDCKNIIQPGSNILLVVSIKDNPYYQKDLPMLMDFCRAKQPSNFEVLIAGGLQQHNNGGDLKKALEDEEAYIKKNESELKKAHRMWRWYEWKEKNELQYNAIQNKLKSVNEPGYDYYEGCHKAFSCSKSKDLASSLAYQYEEHIIFGTTFRFDYKVYAGPMGPGFNAFYKFYAGAFPSQSLPIFVSAIPRPTKATLKKPLTAVLAIIASSIQTILYSSELSKKKKRCFIGLLEKLIDPQQRKSVDLSVRSKDLSYELHQVLQLVQGTINCGSSEIPAFKKDRFIEIIDQSITVAKGMLERTKKKKKKKKKKPPQQSISHDAPIDSSQRQQEAKCYEKPLAKRRFSCPDLTRHTLFSFQRENTTNTSEQNHLDNQSGVSIEIRT